MVGSWRIDDDFKGLHGHEISQLREVLLADLITSELDEFGRVEPGKRADVRRFEHWLEQGREAPPIDVVETNKGKLKITDGHRRYVAAFRQSRKKMLAWVSPGTLVRVSPGNSVFTGLTHELAQSPPTVGEPPPSDASSSVIAYPVFAKRPGASVRGAPGGRVVVEICFSLCNNSY